MTLTKAEIESQALDQYHAVAEKVILADEVVCFDEDNQEVVVMCDPPAVLRIERGDLRETALRWRSSTFFEPIYDVSILEPHRAFSFVRPSHIAGTSVSLKSGSVFESRFVPAPPELQERYRNAPGLDKEEIGACSPPQSPSP